MAEMLMGLLASKIGTLAAGSVGTAMVLWALGKVRDLSAYKSTREAWGRLAMGLGVTVSKLGNTRLKAAWEPIEDVLCDFLLFAVEQFAAGLRKDNPAEIEKQLTRLQEVDSKTRARALAEKLEYLRHQAAPMQDVADAAIAARLRFLGSQSINEKLNP